MGKERTDVYFESEALQDADIQVHVLRGSETIGKLFQFDLVLVCTNPENLNLAELTGEKATIIFRQKDIELRRIHGIIAEVSDLLNIEDTHRSFGIRFVPRAHRLALAETQEVFLSKNVQQIVEEKLSNSRIGDSASFRFIGKPYPSREFVVQYKESDLNFVSRLAEHLGISFFFEHGDDNDNIIFTNHNNGFKQLEGSFPFRHKGEQRDIYNLDIKYTMIPKVFGVQDYNYRNPTADLSTAAEAENGYEGGVIEYGTHHKDEFEAEAMAKLRAEEWDARQKVYSGQSDRCQLSAGHTFTVEAHSLLGDIPLLITEIVHEVVQSVALQGSGAEVAYFNQFKAIDAARPYRPPRAAPKPRIFGVINGIVQCDPVKEPEQHAILDKQGRYSVRFLFDTATHPQNPSHPIRMAQPHAGPNYGHHFPLKPGIEVLIAFIDGDPDRPIIIGSAPNPVTTSPVKMPNALLNRIRTTTGILIEMKDI